MENESRRSEENENATHSQEMSLVIHGQSTELEEMERKYESINNEV